MTPIRCYSFWDVPRAFTVADATGTYLFDCPFDDQLDDYPHFYEIFTMPTLDDKEIVESWLDLTRQTIARLGRIRVCDVRFDASRRKEVDLDGIRKLLQ